ncbi:MAG TPA: hypothetical protein VFZ21_02630 [Gemmatimonadaceae bacterium]|nr:hypothetical protein [Gemmatimonadaceae bacterium]
MEIAIERIVGISFLAVGLSHVLRPAGWAEWFRQLRARGEPGAFVNGMMSLSFGTLIVGFHGTQWSGVPALVTFVGWAQVLKGVVHMCFPAHSLRSMGRVTAAENSWKIPVAGGVMIALSVVMLAGSVT